MAGIGFVKASGGQRADHGLAGGRATGSVLMEQFKCSNVLTWALVDKTECLLIMSTVPCAQPALCWPSFTATLRRWKQPCSQFTDRKPRTGPQVKGSPWIARAWVA